MSENQRSNSNEIAGALTFPSRNEENAEAMPEQPRQPRTLQGLLRFAMEATMAEDAPGASEYGPMDDERRKFLEQVLSTLSVDLSDIMKRAIKVLSDEEKMGKIQLGEDVPEDVLLAFHKILELVDDMDAANDFYKLGGFKIFPICYNSEHENVRMYASSILGEVCQNNPYCQERALEYGLLKVVLLLVQSERGETLIKGLYALSCMCREYTPAWKQLLANGGCEVLSKLLHAEELPARTKAAFLIDYLCRHSKEAKETFIRQNLVKDITVQISKGRDQASEHLLSILMYLTQGRNPTVVQQFCDPQINIRNIIQTHLDDPELFDDTFLEEKMYCEELLSFVASCPQVDSVSEEADR